MKRCPYLAMRSRRASHERHWLVPMTPKVGPGVLAMRPSSDTLYSSTNHHVELSHSCGATGEQYGWVSEETQHERARGALARTSDVLTTGGHDAVDRAHVRPTILQQCSSLPYRCRRTLWSRTGGPHVT